VNESTHLGSKPSIYFIGVFIALIVGGIAYIAHSLQGAIQSSGAPGISNLVTFLPYLLLGIALLIALSFEFVNGFHDTANAVATVIYTNSLPPHFAVVWSGFFNFLGVMFSTGTVAFGIISILPVELILQVGSSAGFAMIFALLIAAIIWNLGTWWLGLPVSSSHTLIGSIIGVGVANALMHGRDGTSGVDWHQTAKIGESLLFSPIIGFAAAALLFFSIKLLVKNKELFDAPQGKKPPPFWIRCMLVFTCTGVSFAHGSNDGQKGMGLIMLILIGAVPIAYALNHPITSEQTIQYVAVSRSVEQQLTKLTPPDGLAIQNPQTVLVEYVRTHKATPELLPALGLISGSLGKQVGSSNNLTQVIGNSVTNLRNEMYLVSETIHLMNEETQVIQRLNQDEQQTLKAFKRMNDEATKYIPLWVKVAVAIALGLGTMVGWKRIVITVGQKIGKSHLTYAQGSTAELVTMLTIGAADTYGLPVSTTHVLTSAVAGTMAANHSGLQLSTIKRLLMAWVLTLPAAVALSAALYFVLSSLFNSPFVKDILQL
jgi:PiT family inorganic phosphate transporter